MYHSNMRSGILDEIESEAIGGDIVKALRRCLALGGRASSTELRDWASRELQGYQGEEVPEYRRIHAPLQIDGVSGHNIVRGQTISGLFLPDFARDTISEEVQLPQSIPGLVRMVAEANRTEDGVVRLGHPDFASLVTYMNSKRDDFSQIERLYWGISPSRIEDVIERVGSILVELVAEMRAGMVSGDVLPTAGVAARAVGVVILGNKNRVRMDRSITNSAQAGDVKGWMRRSLEVAAWLAGIGGLALLLAVNWSTLFH